MIRLIFKISKKKKKSLQKKVEKIHMDSEKSIDLFEIKKK